MSDTESDNSPDNDMDVDKFEFLQSYFSDPVPHQYSDPVTDIPHQFSYWKEQEYHLSNKDRLSSGEGLPSPFPKIDKGVNSSSLLNTPKTSQHNTPFFISGSLPSRFTPDVFTPKASPSTPILLSNYSQVLTAGESCSPSAVENTGRHTPTSVDRHPPTSVEVSSRGNNKFILMMATTSFKNPGREISLPILDSGTTSSIVKEINPRTSFVEFTVPLNKCEPTQNQIYSSLEDQSFQVLPVSLQPSKTGELKLPKSFYLDQLDLCFDSQLSPASGPNQVGPEETNNNKITMKEEFNASPKSLNFPAPNARLFQPDFVPRLLKTFKPKSEVLLPKLLMPTEIKCKDRRISLPLQSNKSTNRTVTIPPISLSPPESSNFNFKPPTTSPEAEDPNSNTTASMFKTDISKFYTSSTRRVPDAVQYGQNSIPLAKTRKNSEDFWNVTLYKDGTEDLFIERPLRARGLRVLKPSDGWKGIKKACVIKAPTSVKVLKPRQPKPKKEKFIESSKIVHDSKVDKYSSDGESGNFTGSLSDEREFDPISQVVSEDSMFSYDSSLAFKKNDEDIQEQVLVKLGDKVTELASINNFDSVFSASPSFPSLPEVLVNQTIVPTCWSCKATQSLGSWHAHKRQQEKFLCSSCFSFYKEKNAERAREEQVSHRFGAGLSGKREDYYSSGPVATISELEIGMEVNLGQSVDQCKPSEATISFSLESLPVDTHNINSLSTLDDPIAQALREMGEGIM